MFKKKYSRKSKRPRRSRFGVYRAAGRQLWRDVMWLKSVVNVERKYSDITFNNTVSDTENFQLLNGLTTGTSATTRNGQSIKIVSTFIRFYITMNASATTTQVRLFLFKDLQPNGAIPTSGQLLQDNSNILSPLLVAYGRRFKIFMDKLFRLDTNKLNIEFKKFFKHKFHTEYNTGTAGTIADITKNSLYVMMVSDQATNTPTVQFWSRIRFIDN